MLDRQVLLHSIKAEIAQLVARRSHNPKVMSSILTFRTAFRSDLSQDIDDVLQTCETMRSCACCGTAHAITRALQMELRIVRVLAKEDRAGERRECWWHPCTAGDWISAQCARSGGLAQEELA